MEEGRVVVDVLHLDGDGRGAAQLRDAAVEGDHEELEFGLALAVQAPLGHDVAALVHEEGVVRVIAQDCVADSGVASGVPVNGLK